MIPSEPMSPIMPMNNNESQPSIEEDPEKEARATASEATSKEDNYMELFVTKELKDATDPINEQLEA